MLARSHSLLLKIDLPERVIRIDLSIYLDFHALFKYLLVWDIGVHILYIV